MQISLIPDLIENKYASAFNRLQDSIWAREKYVFSWRYAAGKENYFICFPSVVGILFFFFLRTYQNLTTRNFLVVSCNTKFETLNFLYCYIKIQCTILHFKSIWLWIGYLENLQVCQITTHFILRLENHAH